jgi:hypothetical protein
LWLLVWLTGSAWGILYLDSLPLRGSVITPGAPEFCLAQTLCLAGWEAVAHCRKEATEHRRQESTWLPRIIGFVLLAALSTCLAFRILDDRWPPEGELFLPEATSMALYAVLLLGGALWYRKRRPDLFMLSCGVFSLATLLVCALIKAQGDIGWEAGSFLLWGLVIAGITAGCGILLRCLHAAMVAEKAAKSEPQASAPGFWEKFRTRFSWEALWAHLREAGLLAGDPPPIPGRPSTPWYVAAQLAVGGWISAFLLVGFLVIMFEALNRDSRAGALLVGGLCFLAVARLLMRRDSVFAEQFALALALAGTAAVAGGVVGERMDERTAILTIGLVIAAIYPFMNNSAYRHIAAVVGLLCVFWGLDYLIWDTLNPRRHGAMEALSRPMYARRVMHTAWYILLCASMAYGWLAEGQWRTHARLNALLPPLLNAMYGFVLLHALLGLWNNRIPGWLLGDLNALGLGAGIGLVYCAHMMTKTPVVAQRTRMLFLGLALLAVVGGWFLPGLCVGLLGLTLGRYRGSIVTLGVTVAALISYFFCYYYNLETSLLYKSIALAGSGVLLCAAAFCIHRMTRNDPAAVAGGGHA